MQDLSVYMVAHKLVPVPIDPVYIPIQAGAAKGNSLGYVRDDTGDNISDRNPKYSEMTALYWIWKNTRSRLVGLVHYRRFFAASTSSIVHSGHEIASRSDLEDQMGKCDLLVVNPLRFFYQDTLIERSVETQYVNTHRPFDLLQAYTAVCDYSPSYVASFNYVMSKNLMVPFNLFVAKRDVMNDFCAWLFPIYDMIDKNTPLPEDEEPYQARVVAFLSERLFTVWIAHNRKKLRIAYRPYVYLDKI